MNKNDLVKYVSDETMITMNDSRIIVDTVIEGIKEFLNEGDKLTLKNFGTFFLQERKQRTALNPRNQEVINVPSKTVVKFKPSKELYNLVNK